MKRSDAYKKLMAQVAAKYQDNPAKDIVDVKNDLSGIDYSKIYSGLYGVVSKHLLEAETSGVAVNPKKLVENIITFMKNINEGEGESEQEFKAGDKKVDSLIEEIASRLFDDENGSSNADGDEMVVAISSKKKMGAAPQNGEGGADFDQSFESWLESFDNDDEFDLFEDIDDDWDLFDDTENDLFEDIDDDNDWDLFEDEFDVDIFDDEMFEDTDDIDLLEDYIDDIDFSDVSDDFFN